MTTARSFLVGTVCAWCFSLALSSTPPLPATIVVFGDSTTAPRGELIVYSVLLEAELRKRGLPVNVINSGVRGNTTEDAARRFERDVIVHRPALVVLQFGINDSAIDVWKTPPATQPRVSLEKYRENLRNFVWLLKQRGVRVVLMTPNPLRWTPRLIEMYGHPPYDVTQLEGFNVTLDPYADAMREIAAGADIPLVDIMAAHREETLHTAEPLLSDGMHPNQRGHALVAERLVDLITREHVLSSARPSGPGKSDG